MKWSDLKYLLGFFGVPLIIFVSLYYHGYWSFFAPVVAFVIIPILDQLIPFHKDKDTSSQPTKTNADIFFDLLLYLNIPIQFALLFYYLTIVSFTPLSDIELVGKTMSMGMGCGILGINVAHELGHRTTALEQWMAKSLLLTSLYMHFFIEHNRGHHKYVSTPDDPATSRLNEPVYFFWFRSIIMGYLSAWKLEKLRLSRKKLGQLHVSNKMIQFTFIQILFIACIYWIFGIQGAICFTAAAAVGILLLETVNYIEHYGLMRKEIEAGVYEKVKPIHSWNSEHFVGRVMLYELSRHSDHHFKATKKYQHLQNYSNNPQLPLGYPGSMMVSLLPPIWYWIMNKRVKKIVPY